MLRPWRFLLVRGAGRARLGELFAEFVRRAAPDASPEEVDKQRTAPTRAPVIVVVAARLEPAHPKIPEVEQMAAVAAATQNMLLAAHALGFAAKWATGKQAYDRDRQGRAWAWAPTTGSWASSTSAATRPTTRRRPAPASTAWSANGRPPLRPEPCAGSPGRRWRCCSPAAPRPPAETPAEALARRELSCTEAGFDGGTPDFRLCLMLQQTNERLAAVERRLTWLEQDPGFSRPYLRAGLVVVGVAQARGTLANSQPHSSVASRAPRSCATMKAGMSQGRMPAKVSDSPRAMVTAGLAKLVELVNQ